MSSVLKITRPQDPKSWADWQSFWPRRARKSLGKDLLDHPLATKLQRCDSVDDILAIFQGQAKEFQQFRDGLMERISPVVTVLHKFSKIAGDVAGTVRP